MSEDQAETDDERAVRVFQEVLGPGWKVYDPHQLWLEARERILRRGWRD